MRAGNSNCRQSGNRRSFVLLRSVAGEDGAYDGIRQVILDAYTRIETAAS